MCKCFNDGASPSVPRYKRLPRNVVPSHYVLEIAPDLEKFTFAGRQEISISVLEKTSEIQLHSADLEIFDSFVESADGTRLAAKVSFDAANEIAIFNFEGVIGTGEWKLHSKFTGVLNDRLKGFYRSFWKDKDGKQHTIAVTQFEACDARRAFPCWDEPDRKATFEVSLIVDKELTALSNTKVVKEEHLASDDGSAEFPLPGFVSKGKKRVSYAKTIKMSTYLVAFVVGEFVSSKPVMVNGKEIRVWAVPGREHLMSFGLQVAAASTDFYENYFNLPFQGDKIDHIAIPDFSAGAMENHGCITYRETALLVDLATATFAAIFRVALVVAHETAHNIHFGNTVTMEDWDGLWLNETFANFMEYVFVNWWKPEWKANEEFALQRAAAFRTDSLKSTHSIQTDIKHPDQIDEMFDIITYVKGHSVMHQLYYYVGDEVFRKALQGYFKKHIFGNTKISDLWDALEGASEELQVNEPVRHIMDNWVLKPGHPVLEVKAAEEEGCVTISQRRFQFIDDPSDKTYWPIPVMFRAERADGTVVERKFVFDKPSETVYVGNDFKYVVFNADGNGFYRVVYSKELDAKLAANLDKMNVVERFNLVNDSWAAVRAGVESAADYLAMVKLFVNEDDPNVWAIIAGSVKTLYRLTSGDERKAMTQFIVELATPMYQKLGWIPSDKEPVQTRELRGQLIGILGTIGEVAEVRQKANSYFDAWKLDRSSVDANIVPDIVSILAYTGGEERYDEFVKLAQAATNPQEELRFLGALTAFRDEKLLARTVEKCLSEHIRTQDAPSIYSALFSNEEADQLAWDFLIANFDKMEKAYPQSGFVRLCAAASSLDEPQLEKSVREFFATRKVKSGDMAIAQMLEQLEINARLRRDHTAPLGSHLVAMASSNKVPV